MSNFMVRRAEGRTDGHEANSRFSMSNNQIITINYLRLQIFHYITLRRHLN